MSKINEDTVKISVIGLDGAGKTTLIAYLRYGRFISDITPTIGLNTEVIKFEGLTFHVWDLGGQMQFRKTIWEQYTENSKGIIYVIDAANRRRFPEAREYLWKMMNLEHLKGRHIPFCILANKIDLVPELTEKDLANYMGISSYLSKDIRVFRTSSKTGEGVTKALRWLSERIAEQHYELPRLSYRRIMI